jgi:probable F420-dependent oxidoreductase
VHEREGGGDHGTEVLGELGFYALAGHSDTPADALAECRQAEAIGLGSAFISERFNVKDAPSLTGAMAAVTEHLGVATGVTNHNTRHPLVTATWANTVHHLSGGRFALGLGRGFDPLFDAIGAPRVTSAQIEDVIGIYRRLWRGETVLGHDGPAGRYPYLSIGAGAGDDGIPVLLAALGPKTLELAGRVADGVILHTFFTDEGLARCVERVRAGAEQAGRDPAAVRVWAVLAVVCDRPEDHLLALVGRLATYCQVYGEALVAVNGWDQAVVDRLRADEVVRSVPGAIDAAATPDQLEHIATLLPDEWLAASAVGGPEHCARRVVDQFDAGADSVILHAATPPQLATTVEAYRAIRPASRATLPVNPGR